MTICVVTIDCTMDGEKTILIAGTSAEILAALSGPLVADGCNIVSADNGIDAVKKSMLLRPELIILDDGMEDISGYQACRLLKDDPDTSAIDVVILTSGDDSPSGRCCKFAAGQSADVPKSGAPQETVAVIRRMLDKNGSASPMVHKPATERVVEDIDIIRGMNSVLAKSACETSVLRGLAGLARNIFSYDDLVVAVMEMFCRTEDYLIMVVSSITEDESRLAIHLNDDISAGLFSKIRALAVGMVRDNVPCLDLSRLWVRIIREDRIVRDRDVSDIDSDTFVFSRFENSGILHMGFIVFGVRGKMDGDKEFALNAMVKGVCPILENLWLYGRLYRDIKSQATTDSLTTIFNHRHIVFLISQEFSRAKRYKHCVSLVMIDLDYFKDVNDTFGHQAGDDVLREVVAIMKDSMRESDNVGRWGGEEFAILLPETDTEEAVLFADRLRARIAQHKFVNLSDPVKLTASMGVSSYPVDAVDNPQSFIKCADRALYRAKGLGRNMVCDGNGLSPL